VQRFPKGSGGNRRGERSRTGGAVGKELKKRASLGSQKNGEHEVKVYAKDDKKGTGISQGLHGYTRQWAGRGSRNRKVTRLDEPNHRSLLLIRNSKQLITA